ncbi:hypothetical protein [Helicobacter bizzozeronii]|nr:hypothetical protein [Helicobacter bizzozeronii]
MTGIKACSAATYGISITKTPKGDRIKKAFCDDDLLFLDNRGQGAL